MNADKEVVLAAVSSYDHQEGEGDGDLLQFASDELKADKEVVLAAVSREGNVLYYASEELKADKEVVLTALSRYWPGPSSSRSDAP